MCDDIDHSPTSDDINLLFNEIETGDDSEHQSVMQKLQAIRLWQLKQQEELKKQQQTQLALLKSQTSDVSSSTSDNDDEILAVPLSNFSAPLDTILEQSTVLDETMPYDDNSSQQENDPILNQIKAKMVSFKNSVSTEEDYDEANCDQAIEASDFSLQNKICHSEDHSNTVEELYSDVETSFEKVSPKQITFDEVPVKSGKTFDEILTEQLARDEKQNHVETKQKVAHNVSTPKRPFLRKGQGIARFNGPPKKSKIKKKAHSQENNSATADSEKTQAMQKLNGSDQQAELETAIFNKQSHKEKEEITCLDEKEPIQVFSKPCVRKTARLTRREPMKQLSLRREVTASPKMEALVRHEIASSENDQHNESAWSEVEDTALALDASGMNAHNTTSNETFEQMEQFCNDFYADVSTVKTLEDDDSMILQKIKPLPPNKLMLRLFPTLRQDNVASHKKDDPSRKIAVDTNSSPKPDETKSKTLIETQVLNKPTSISSLSPDALESSQSEILKAKLEEMQMEIKHFQDETAKLSDVRKKEENQLQVLKQEFEEFQRQKEEELERLAEFKKAEIKKLKNDRKLFEEHAAAAKALPNKKDREHIQELEGKIDKMQKEFKLKEQRLNAVNNRLRSQLESTMEENEKFKEKFEKLQETVRKFEAEKEARKNKKSQAAWKAINDIVDAIPVNNENANIDDYIESRLQPTEGQIKPLPLRSPLSNRNDNNLNNSDVTVHEGKIERRKKDGSLEINFQNGTKKSVFPDGTMQIRFTNGDVKTVFPDGIVKYHYTVSGTWHTTHPNGMQVIEFSNKQIERHFPDGSKHITFEDGSSKMIKLNGSEETIFTDGTVMIVSPSGDKTIEYSNGQRETHTAEFKRREYPDGTCKTVFADGRQETKYSSGRLRIKDANGVLIVDKILST